MNLHTDAPVVQKVFELYKLFYQYIDHFPKKSRVVLAVKIERLIAELLELVSQASLANHIEKIKYLTRSSTIVDTLKLLFRLSYELKIIDQKKYLQLEGYLQEIGRMTGGWIRSLKNTNPDL